MSLNFTDKSSVLLEPTVPGGQTQKVDKIIIQYVKQRYITQRGTKQEVFFRIGFPEGTFPNSVKASKGQIDIYKYTKHTTSEIPSCFY